MKSKKPKKTGWIDIRKVLKKFQHSQLIELTENLYKLSQENKTFLIAHCLNGDEAIKRYKKVILDYLYPDVMNPDDTFDFERAEKTIKDFAKATGDNTGIVDLMIYFVECGNQFTLDYGDIDEVFCDTLIEMYEKAVGRVCRLPKNKQGPFRKRLEKIMKSADGIGWGYHDDLVDVYYGAFQSR